MTSRLVVVAFEGASTAAGVLDVLRELERDDAIALEDAVLVSRESAEQRIFASAVGGADPLRSVPVTVGATGQPRIEQTTQRRGRSAALAGGVGLAIGWLFGGPIGGAAIGAILGSLRDRGVDDGFVRELSEQLQPDSSALFLLVERADTDKVLEQMRPFKGRVLHTTLTPDVEQQLHRALAQAG